ncbi:MarR family transcriptional regulator [Kribbella sp. NPDC051620]|uniref:SCO6745 family protein n=1 Tax=Kribbella sp. NPDC051620 TaxID=3364120 RepID=UPI0037B785AD
MENVARLLKDLFVPIHEVAYMADEPNEELQALGYEGYWPLYFASRSAPLGQVPAEVVDALFYNFAPGEVAACIPSVWDVATPEAVLAARQRGCVAALRHILGDLADSPVIARAAELFTKAAFSAPLEGRVLFAALRSLPVPEEPLAKLWHAATLLREHRGDGHTAALVANSINGQESHVLLALFWDMKPREFGRLDPLTDDQLAEVIDGLHHRGLIDNNGGFTPAGRKLRTNIESLTDALAAPAYTCLTPQEIEELTTDLPPLIQKIKAASPF